MYNVINSIDENAFIIEFDVNSVKGGVLRKYLSTEKNKKLPSTLYNSNNYDNLKP